MCVHPSFSAHERAANDVEDHVFHFELLHVAKIWKSSVTDQTPMLRAGAGSPDYVVNAVLAFHFTVKAVKPADINLLKLLLSRKLVRVYVCLCVYPPPGY